MHMFEEHNKTIYFLRFQNENFLGWICPHLKEIYVPQDQYVYYETDEIEEIFFITQGNCGFVLPFKKNIVYIEVEKGDTLGDIDFLLSAILAGTSLE